MFRLGKLASASMVALCLCVRSAVGGDAGAHPIRIVCDDVRLAVLCDELARAMSLRQANHPVELAERAMDGAHLTLRFEAGRVGDSVLSGRLVWNDGSGRTGTGAEIDLTVMDASIDDEMMRDYARQLLSVTRLPL